MEISLIMLVNSFNSYSRNVIVSGFVKHIFYISWLF